MVTARAALRSVSSGSGFGSVFIVLRTKSISFGSVSSDATIVPMRACAAALPVHSSENIFFSWSSVFTLPDVLCSALTTSAVRLASPSGTSASRRMCRCARSISSCRTIFVSGSVIGSSDSIRRSVPSSWPHMMSFSRQRRSRKAPKLASAVPASFLRVPVDSSTRLVASTGLMRTTSTVDGSPVPVS